MTSGRLWLVLAVVAVVAAILLGYRVRVMLAGGRAVLLLAMVGMLLGLAISCRARRMTDGS